MPTVLHYEPADLTVKRLTATNGLLPRWCGERVRSGHVTGGNATNDRAHVTCKRCLAKLSKSTNTETTMNTNKPAPRAFDASTFCLDGQAQNGAVNVDALSNADLGALARHPATNDAVKRYAELSIEARAERVAGRIDRAVRLEDKAERLYTTAIPKHLRW